MTLQKNILYIGGFELPDKNAAAQRVIGNAKILRNLGYNVMFISIDKSLVTLDVNSNIKSNYDGFDYYKIGYPRSLLNWIIYLVSIKNIVRLNNIHFSHIIAYNYPAIALFRLIKYCHKKKIQIISDCTEWEETDRGNFLFKSIKKIDTYLRMKVLHPRLDGNIVISKYLYNYYIKYNKRIILVPPLVDLKMNKWKLNWEYNNDQLQLVYAGNPGTGQKDRLDLIINTLSKIKRETSLNVFFNIIGISKSEYLDSFGVDSIPSNISDYISYKGRLPHSTTISEIAKSDFLIFLRDKTLKNMAGFPTKFVESISCGTPILTNKTSNIDDYLIEGKNGFFIDVTTENSLFETLSTALLKNNQIRLEMKRYCLSSKLFDYNNYLSEFDNFIH